MQEGVKLEFVEDLWVQCDAPSCRKWRRLPGGTVVGDHGRWYCRMNPDPLYNACDIEEEYYDTRNEILLTTAPEKGTNKSRTRSKKRKHETKKEPPEKAVPLKAELQKRQQWCEKKLKALGEGGVRGEWALEQGQYLHIHAPEATDALLELMDHCSATEYFREMEDPESESLTEKATEMQRELMKSALEAAKCEIHEMLQEVQGVK